MSIWTHINGCIRIDGMKMLIHCTKDDVRKILGDTCSWESETEEWDACTVPCGSEGSLQYDLQDVGGENSLVWLTVSIWGDLRNYDNINEIEKWFKETIEKIEKSNKGISLRGAVIQIEVSGVEFAVFAYEGENGWKDFKWKRN